MEDAGCPIHQMNPCIFQEPVNPDRAFSGHPGGRLCRKAPQGGRLSLHCALGTLRQSLMHLLVVPESSSGAHLRKMKAHVFGMEYEQDRD